MFLAVTLVVALVLGSALARAVDVAVLLLPSLASIAYVCIALWLDDRTQQQSNQIRCSSDCSCYGMLLLVLLRLFFFLCRTARRYIHGSQVYLRQAGQDVLSFDG